MVRVARLTALLLATPYVAVQAQADTTRSFAPTVRVALQLDSASTAQFTARDFELRVARAPGSTGTAATEIQLVKRAGAHTGSLLGLSASGAQVPTGVIEVFDAAGRPAMTLRLRDVAIVSDRVTLSASGAALEQQRLSQQEQLSGLTADYHEAERQLAAEEKLSKLSGGSTRMDLARARDRASDLERRIALLQERQLLLASQHAGQGPLDETIVLRFGALDIESPESGERATIDVAGPVPARNR